MAISLEQFAKNLTRSGLFSADELSAFRENLPPEKRPNGAQGLARELIQAGKLPVAPGAGVPVTRFHTMSGESWSNSATAPSWITESFPAF